MMSEENVSPVEGWIEAYRIHVLEEGEPPASVYAFCSKIGIEESEFFKEFSSLEALESEIWAERIRFVRDTLNGDKDYADYSPHQKSLAFFYTFLEAIMGQRSWYLARFPREYPSRDPLFLQGFRRSFMEWANEVAQENRDGAIAKRINAKTIVANLLYAHFRSIIKFALEDKSKGFERTDAYVEKSTRLFFELADANLAESAVDLFRFLSGRQS
ncbi:MAG: hypothetical protein AAGJ81_03210 [Verrucomicrobiota bacterium]